MEPIFKKVATAIVVAALVNYTPINAVKTAHVDAVRATIARTEESTIATNLAATIPLPQMSITTLVTAMTTFTTSNTVVTTTTSANQEETLTQAEDETNTTDVDYSKIYLDFDMDVSQPSALSRAEFVSLMSNMSYDYYGYFARNAGVFWDTCHTYGVNEFFACGITAWESGWGECEGFGSNNYFGICGGDYATEAEGVEALVSLLANNYLSEEGSCYYGKTITAVGNCYCEPYNWPSCVYGCMTMMA